MKYIIGYSPITGYYHPAVFGEGMIHAKAAEALRGSVPKVEIVGAGFVHRVEIPPPLAGYRWRVSKEERAASLNIYPGSNDELLLTLFLEVGLEGLDLANHLALAEVEALRRRPPRPRRGGV